MATSFVSLLPVFFSFEFLEFVPFFVILRRQAECDQINMVTENYIYILEAFRFRSWYMEKVCLKLDRMSLREEKFEGNIKIVIDFAEAR